MLGGIMSAFLIFQKMQEFSRVLNHVTFPWQQIKDPISPNPYQHLK
jgi:hypothetical protein